MGTFTSPHVHTIRERIRVGDSLISRDALVRHAVSLEETFRNNSWLLFFDRILAVALLHFAEVQQYERCLRLFILQVLQTAYRAISVRKN